MKLESKSIFSSLNKAFLSQNIFVDSLNIFKENYQQLHTSIQQNDNEETIKDYINKFLDNTFYRNKFIIKENENNIDLVIYNGNTQEDKIGIIIETKALKNNAEMINENDINRKSFHELVQYYLEQRIIHANQAIKHLIITNSKEWYIFNCTEFERLFYLNKQFNASYQDWHSGKLASKNKDWFYAEIAKPFIANSEETIVCTYFQLSESLELTESSWIELYKIFSPEHLLKLPFANDSNSLNQEFYDELLHIIGLYETKDNAKHIERLKVGERNSGSFLESVIAIIESEEILERIKNLQSFENPQGFENLEGLDEEEQLFSIALELCLTWINRIVFLKLLESQLLKYNDKKDEYRFLNIQKIKDFNDLRELFFDVLAVLPNERKNTLDEKYAVIPYLNSSLFEQNILEKEAVKINHLKHNTEIPVFQTTVLKDDSGKRITGKKNLLQYLFEFLESYNFASNHKTEVQEKPKTLINSSVLGLIFEKLNGYKEGSFYTPGYVTMYICRETIRNTVIQKFKPHLNLSDNLEFSESWVELYNKISKMPLKQANEIFNSIKICDPAVGSGHFLVSTLNELIAIKSELGILIDKNGQLFRKLYCDVQNDELYISYHNELFVYDFKDKESQRIQETMFEEKRTLIENCLFGVDINPKSVYICRLRLWIELLKNAYYRSETLNTKAIPQLETLPNIDINIKCGNSLVSFFNLNGNGFSKTQMKNIQGFTKEYKKQVSLYKDITDKTAKEKIVKNIKMLKNTFMDYANPNDKDYKELKKKEGEHGATPIFFNRNDQIEWNTKQEKLYKEITVLEKIVAEKQRSLYAKAFEWRFEFPEVLDDNGYFVGFDAVVGNPPYISAVDMSRNQLQKDYFKLYYPEATGAYDIFILFLKKATELVKKNGSYAWIVPNKFLAAQYAKNTREMLLNTGLYYSVDISHIKVFEKASVYPIMIFGRNKTEKVEFKEYKAETEIDLLKNNLIEYSKSNVYKTFKEMGIKIMSGTTGFEAQKIKQFISEKPVKGSIPFIVSGCIDKYSIDFENVRYMGTKYSLAFIQNNKQQIASTKWNFWNNKKIVIAGMTKQIESVWADSPLAIGVGTYGIYDFGKYHHLFILGLLNSSFMTNYVLNKFRDKHLAGGYLAINKNMIEEFPIIDIDLKQQEPVIEIVEKILTLKKENPENEVATLKTKIDKLILKLFKNNETT